MHTCNWLWISCFSVSSKGMLEKVESKGNEKFYYSVHSYVSMYGLAFLSEWTACTIIYPLDPEIQICFWTQIENYIITYMVMVCIKPIRISFHFILSLSLSLTIRSSFFSSQSAFGMEKKQKKNIYSAACQFFSFERISIFFRLMLTISIHWNQFKYRHSRRIRGIANCDWIKNWFFSFWLKEVNGMANSHILFITDAEIFEVISNNIYFSCKFRI